MKQKELTPFEQTPSPENTEGAIEAIPETPEAWQGELAPEKALEIVSNETEQAVTEEDARLETGMKNLGFSSDETEALKQETGIGEELNTNTEEIRTLAEKAMDKLKSGLRVLGVTLPIAMGQGNALAQNTFEASRLNQEVATEQIQAEKVKILELKSFGGQKKISSDLSGNKDLVIDSPQLSKGDDSSVENKGKESIPSPDETSEVSRTKSELLMHIESAGYLERLTVELGGNADEAKKLRQDRFENVNRTDFKFLTPEEMKRRFGADDPKGTRVEAISPYNENTIYLPTGTPLEKLHETARHEFEHKATNLNEGIPQETKKILNESFHSYTDNKGRAQPGLDGYFKNPTEHFVRKQQADFEMERLGIKKYGEEFTEEHYEKLIAEYEKGNLTRNTREFIRTTDPKDFIRIFNTIAENEEERGVGDNIVALSSSLTHEQIDQAAKDAVKNFEQAHG